jgi:CO dehydrogenase/acetyl-CoA synthase epsilon subunit
MHMMPVQGDPRTRCPLFGIDGTSLYALRLFLGHGAYLPGRMAVSVQHAP